MFQYSEKAVSILVALFQFVLVSEGWGVGIAIFEPITGWKIKACAAARITNPKKIPKNLRQIGQVL